MQCYVYRRSPQCNLPMIWLWCLGFQVCYVCKISDSVVIFWLVWFICCVLKLFEYSSIHCSVCQNLGTALHIMRGTKSLWVTGAAHKACNAWNKNEWSDLCCQIASPWHELLIRLAWASTLLTCTLEATGLNLRQDTIWSVSHFCDSPQYLQMNTLKYVMTACTMFQSPSRTHYTVQWYCVYSNITQDFFLKYDAWMSEVIRNSCMNWHTRLNQLDHADPNQDLHCQIIM